MKQNEGLSTSKMIIRCIIKQPTRMNISGVSRDWEHFKVVMLDKYFPDNIRAQKELEFQLL